MQNNYVAADVSSRSLIIAERAKNVRQLLNRELSRDGYRVLCLATGADLCRELEANGSSRVILLDPELPGLADDSVLQWLRRVAGNSSLIIHSYGAQPYPPLADLTLGNVSRTGDIEALKKALVAAVHKNQAL